jgi:hypothetical protein
MDIKFNIINKPSDQHSILKAQMQHGLTMVDKCVQLYARLGIPNSDRGIAASAGDYLVVILKTQHRTGVPSQCLNALQCGAVPNLLRKPFVLQFCKIY